MTYSIIGLLAAIILIITNRDAFWPAKGVTFSKTQRLYRLFLLSVLGYYITDGMWGVWYNLRLIDALYVETILYFIAMAVSLLFWTMYVTAYLETHNAFGTILRLSGRILFAYDIVALTINIFYPVVFWLDENGSYQTGSLRYVTLYLQILIFFMTSVYTLYITAKSEGKVRRRNLTIGLFGIAMLALIILQIEFPLWPCHTIGYMFGTSLLHSFVVEDEKEEYRRELEETLHREKAQRQELAESREALQDALDAAESANKAKTAFLSNMSHEIRTPMNAIIGLNSIALNDPTASEEVKKYLEKSVASAQHLLGIINDILDMSRIESGRMTVKNEEFLLDDALKQVNGIISEQCRDKGLVYDHRKVGKIDKYYIGDAMKLKQVLINILGNAVKFTPEGGSVSLVIEGKARFDKKAVVEFVISDTGIGMSKEFLPHIFEPFSQEESSPTGKYGSTGLGMSITKSIVELMNGTITVDSEKGKGTTFSVTITFGESEKKSIDNDIGMPALHDMSVLTAKTADLIGRRVLLAEDVSINAEIITMLLSMREMEVDLAENGQIAVDLFAAHEPGYYAAILMDMRMPVMGGLEATRCIRSTDKEDAKTIPIIALTANAFDEDVQRSIQAGLNAHLSKPVEPDALYETLEKLIGISSAATAQAAPQE